MIYEAKQCDEDETKRGEKEIDEYQSRILSSSRCDSQRRQ